MHHTPFILMASAAAALHRHLIHHCKGKKGRIQARLMRGVSPSLSFRALVWRRFGSLNRSASKPPAKPYQQTWLYVRHPSEHSRFVSVQFFFGPEGLQRRSLCLTPARRPSNSLLGSISCRSAAGSCITDHVLLRR